MAFLLRVGAGMSFVRPEVAARLKTYAEPLFWCAILVLLCLVLLRMWPVAHWGILALIGLAIGGVGIAGVNAWLRARLTRRADAKGVVLIDEGRIGYFGPEAGGFVEIDALFRVELRGTSMGTKFWVLHHKDGQPLNIPEHAPGAAGLLDSLASLPGLGLAQIARYLGAPSDITRVIWQRPD